MKVTIYSTAGINGNVVDLLSTVTTYGQLKTAVGNSYPWATSNVADESEKEYTSDSDTIPSEDFCLFVYPRQTKSGATMSKLPYNAVKRTINNIVDDSDEAEDFFGNFEILSTLELNEMLTKWYAYEEKMKSEEDFLDNTISLEDICKFIDYKYIVYTSDATDRPTVGTIVSSIVDHFAMPDLCQIKYKEIAKKKGWV